MVKNYNALEGELSVRGTPTVSRSGTTNAVAIIGGYDAANAASDVTAGEATKITDPTSAEDTFGDSEIPRAAEAVAANGVGTLYGVPVPESSETETISAGQSITLANTPVFDPTFHPDHEIVVKEDTSGDGTYDTTLDTNVVYDDPPATPSESDTANVNPIVGKVETDSSGDYEIAYDYGDYSTAIETAGDLPVRYLNVLSEADSVKSSTLTVLSNIAQDFDFKRAVFGATPEITATDIGDYTPNQRDWRLVEVAPAHGTGASGKVRTSAAVTGALASQPIGPDGSVLFDSVGGLTALNKGYRPSEAKNFGAVTSLTRDGVFATEETTSDVGQFRLVYACEIIDDVALDLFSVARDYAGGPQDINELETLLEVVCLSASSGSPPLLGFGKDAQDDPYDVNVQLGASSDVAEAGVQIVPSPIAETVNLSLTVTDGFVEFEGAN